MHPKLALLCGPNMYKLLSTIAPPPTVIPIIRPRIMPPEMTLIHICFYSIASLILPPLLTSAITFTIGP